MESVFAQCMHELMNAGPYRGSWDRYLILPHGTCASWVADQAIPSAPMLNLLHDACQRFVPAHDAMARFNEIRHEDARKISPFGRLMLPTVSAYMSRPFDHDINVALAGMFSRAEQEQYLESIYPSR